MLTVLRNSWALLLGVMLLLLGNGIQSTLLGIRGKIEGFSPVEMSYVMSAYYAGFLFGSRFTPDMIRRVGHVRVFAALGSMISAVLILSHLLRRGAAASGRVGNLGLVVDLDHHGQDITLLPRPPVAKKRSARA